MLLHPLEEEYQRNAGQREICQQAEVVGIGEHGRLLEDAPV
jgi:hypothetical protein